MCEEFPKVRHHTRQLLARYATTQETCEESLRELQEQCQAGPRISLAAKKEETATNRAIGP
jgi:hypothetical protein